MVIDGLGIEEGGEGNGVLRGAVIDECDFVLNFEDRQDCLCEGTCYGDDEYGSCVEHGAELGFFL